MNVNCYLPDALGNEAKQAGLNFSRLLRHAVQEKMLLVRDSQGTVTRDWLELNGFIIHPSGGET
jgi:post-segregation antitoxin (ccd killing protein)